MDRVPSISKSVRVFRFDPHPRRKQFTVVGETKISIERNGKIFKEIVQPFKKLVKLLGLNPSSRVDAVVSDVTQGFPFVDGNALRASLKETIEELQNREYDANGVAITRRIASDGSFLPRYLEVFEEVVDSTNNNMHPLPKTSHNSLEDVDIRNLNQYVEMLYEDVPNKIEGLRQISLLTKSNRYLVEIHQHASATNAIFRTLREDSAKNLDLTLHIFSICVDFAKLRSFHRFLIVNKIHQRVLDILDFEMERCEKWKAQLLKRENNARTASVPKAIEEYITLNDNLQTRIELQNVIIKMGVDILHFLSEDRNVSVGLLHQGVVTSLTDALDRTDFNLWESVLSFLKDMSVFKEYVQQMVNVDTLGKLCKILKGKTAIPVKVARMCFALLCNMSFNRHLRHEVVRQGLLSVFGKCILKSSFADTIAKTLYLISLDANCREKIAKTGVVETLLGQLVPETEPCEKIPRIKGALAVNLAKCPKAANVMCESIKLAVLLKHSIKNHDTLGMKIVRNVVENRSSTIIDQQAGHIARAVVEVNSLDFVLECVGVLAHLNVDVVNFPELLKTNRLVVWLKRQIMNYMNMTNIATLTYQLKTAALEVVILLSNICKKEEGARFIVGEGFLDQILIRLLLVTHTDPQIVQQIAYLFNVCCRHESVATFLATKTQFPQELLAFVMGIGGQVRTQCDATLHKLSEFDPAWHETMMEHEFLLFNEKWTNAVTAEFNRNHLDLSPSAYVSNTKPFLDHYHEKFNGVRDPYAEFLNYDDEDDLERPSSCDVSLDLFDDSSATDDDTTFYSQSSNNMSSSILVSDMSLHKRSLGNINLYELYREQFEEEMALSQDWKFFLQV